MPIPIMAVMAAAQMGQQLYSSYKQNKAADELKLQDSTTAAEREQMAMSRMGASSARLPGMGYQEGRLAQVQAGAMQNARLGAGSSADYLASAGAADLRRQQGEQQLGIQGLQYQDKMRGQLRTDLSAQTRRKDRDLAAYNQEKAALTQASAENLHQAVETGASYGAMAYNGQQGGGMGAGGTMNDGLYSRFPGDGNIGMYPRGLGTGRHRMGSYGR
jgi:hypothetical protein